MVNPVIPQHSQVPLHRAALQQVSPKPVLVPGVAPPQVQDPALARVEPHQVPLCPTFQPGNSTRIRLFHISLGPGLCVDKAGGKYHREGRFAVVRLPCWRKTLSGLEMSFHLVIWRGRAEHAVQECKLILVSKSSLANA